MAFTNVAVPETPAAVCVTSVTKVCAPLKVVVDIVKDGAVPSVKETEPFGVTVQEPEDDSPPKEAFKYLVVLETPVKAAAVPLAVTPVTAVPVVGCKQEVVLATDKPDTDSTYFVPPEAVELLLRVTEPVGVYEPEAKLAIYGKSPVPEVVEVDKAGNEPTPVMLYTEVVPNVGSE